MVKEKTPVKIAVKSKMKLNSLLFVGNNDIHWNAYGAGTFYPTAEEIVEKYSLEARNGELYLVEKI